MTTEAIDAAISDSLNTRTQGGFANCPDLDALMRSKEFAVMTQASLMMIAATPTTESITIALVNAFLAGMKCGRADAEARALEGLL